MDGFRLKREAHLSSWRANIVPRSALDPSTKKALAPSSPACSHLNGASTSKSDGRTVDPKTAVVYPPGQTQNISFWGGMRGYEEIWSDISGYERYVNSQESIPFSLYLRFCTSQTLRVKTWFQPINKSCGCHHYYLESAELSFPVIYWKKNRSDLGNKEPTKKQQKQTFGFLKASDIPIEILILPKIAECCHFSVWWPLGVFKKYQYLESTN